MFETRRVESARQKARQVVGSGAQSYGRHARTRFGRVKAMCNSGGFGLCTRRDCTKKTPKLDHTTTIFNFRK